MMRPLLLALCGAVGCGGQDFSQRGFLDIRLLAFPQTAANDRGRFIGDALLRYEASLKVRPWLRFAGTVDGRTDSRNQTRRDWGVDWQDRTRQRPAISLRRFSVILSRSGLSVEAGKQFVRWGKADILNPTDRFAPRDFLAVIDNDFLGIVATRVLHESGGNTFDLVWAPRFTPSRVPLLNQRWTVVPAEAASLPIRDAGVRLPGRSQFGARWSRLGRALEYSLCFYEGFNHLPLIRPFLVSDPLAVGVERFQPRLRLFGGDFAAPLRWFTVKGEAAWFQSRTPQADEFAQYVIQVERQSGELSLVGGYAGEVVTRRRNPLDFAPDRGLTRAFLGRASYTIDARRSAALEAAIRQDGAGSWTRAEFSQLLSAHWRISAGFTWIRGAATDFIGQFRRNSHASVTLRYSF